MADDYVLVLTTLPDDAGQATAIARTLVSERLVACASILGSMTSVYRWQGDIQQDPERQVIFKTMRGRLEALEARLRKLHPYEVPEFIVLSIGWGSDLYLSWVRDSVSPGPG